jgi:ribosomal RNA assembly protein
MQQEEVTKQRRAERAEAFVAPMEDVVPTVEEKRKRKGRADEGDAGAEPVDGKTKTKKKKKRKQTVEEES